MQDFAKTFYSSKAWKECRQAFAKSKSGLCERCLKSGIFTPGEIVHHKTPLTESNIADPSITLDWNNLQLVCRECHAAIHKPDKRYKVDEFGRITARA